LQLESYEVFCALVEQGSATQAARVLHMTQSTASRHLQALEDEFGGLLFERDPRGLTLTQLGRGLYPYAREMLACHLRAREELSRLQGPVGTVVVGATLTIAETLLPPCLGELHARFPQAAIRMRVSNTADIVQDLLHRRIDVALIEGEADTAADLVVTVWHVDELLLVCCPSDELAGRAALTLDDVVGHPLLVREQGSGTRQAFELALEQVGYAGRMSVAMELGSNQALKAAVEAGLGAAVLSRLSVVHECRENRLVAREIVDCPIRRNFYIALRRERYTRPLVDAFLEIVRAS
jgi:DNA-binding transcriptional LysR family regulator